MLLKDMKVRHVFQNWKGSFFQTSCLMPFFATRNAGKIRTIKLIRKSLIIWIIKLKVFQNSIFVQNMTHKQRKKKHNHRTKLEYIQIKYPPISEHRTESAATAACWYNSAVAEDLANPWKCSLCLKQYRVILTATATAARTVIVVSVIRRTCFLEGLV